MTELLTKGIRLHVRQRGLSLIELMIAMTLGILIVGGMATLFVQNKYSYGQDERIARMQEEARFALNELVNDVEFAGFWGNFFQPPGPGSLDSSLDVSQDCGDGSTNWIYDVLQSVSIHDEPTSTANPSASFECIVDSEYAAGTDIIFVKRLQGNPVATLNDNHVYLQTNGTQGLLFRHPMSATPPVNVAGTVTTWEYEPALYYVRNFAETAGDGIPTLCRFRLDYESSVPPSVEEECIARGVENLQFEYGIDTDDDGVANRYLGSPTAAQLTDQLVSVRIHLLMRSLTEDPGYVNAKSYTLGNTTYDPDPDDGFYRRVYTTTVLLRNSRNLLCMATGGC